MTEESERNFEELFNELEDTVRRLEAGDLALGESLALFERASALAERCNHLLDQAELRVHQLVVRPDTGLEAAPFDGGHDQ